MAESSRVIVKNLPKKITPERLRQILSVKGTITDVKLMHTAEGVFRRFAYVGFERPSMAEQAVKYFHGTFIDTSRIQVDRALPMGDAELATPWSKYSRGSSAFKRINGGAEDEEEKKRRRLQETERRAKADAERRKHFLQALYEDSEQQAFVAAMRKPSKTRTWENDDSAPAASKPRVKVDAVASKKPGGEGVFVQKVHVTFGDDGESDEDYQALPSAKPRDSTGDGSDACGEDVRAAAGGDEAPDVLDTGRLFVRNLAYTCVEADLRALFEKFGPLAEVHLPISSETKHIKGFAYILFMVPENAVAAMGALDGAIFQGRLLHVLPGKAAKTAASPAGGFKAAKEAEQRAMAGSSLNWNSFFIKPDTIADAVAEKLGVRKADIVDVRSPDLATRMAVAETHLIQDTKAYLESHGLVLDAFSAQSAARSECIILVKNIPFSTDVGDLRALFGKHGQLGRILLPPTKAMAVVEFLVSAEAKAAFRSLAYSKFKTVPLFLEWAPLGSLSAGADEASVVRLGSEAPVARLGSEADSSPSHTLHVKNVSFGTTEADLRRCFEAVGPLRSVKIATKRDPRRGVLSLGFGFVEYADADATTKAIDTMQGHVLDGHALVLSKSTGAAVRPAATTRKRPAVQHPDWLSERCTKLVVRNVPFEATERELRELFKSFAQVKSVRLPKKFDRRHRGFGFVEFITHQEAKSAYETLLGTHFYGRHLVLEWAKPDAVLADIDELRKKSAVQPGVEKRKLRLEQVDALDVDEHDVDSDEQ